LQKGPAHLVKRNQPAAVVLTEADYERLAAAADRGRQRRAATSALDWLLDYRPTVRRTHREIDAKLAAERAAWDAAG
jgi:hypothetical protein